MFADATLAVVVVIYCFHFLAMAQRDRGAVPLCVPARARRTDSESCGSPMRNRQNLRDRSPEAIAFHRDCAHKHAARRAFERLGIVVAPSDITAQLALIKSGKAEKIADGCAGRQLYAMPWKGRPELLVVYCPSLDAVATYLPHRNWFYLSEDVRILNKAA